MCETASCKAQEFTFSYQFEQYEQKRLKTYIAYKE